ncbi:MAG: UDP-4-amino-4,6-dideoxy-N-acetyl-beta-L-altrosamine transaminase [Candidatus Cloacimonadota bacterium]|nr:MAG: UDP-4-amino-4,6-dideoxy-N-acetyl-beta-L-altrosamine transaminase [Candidatus Cloacimonadota bacterium]
MKKDSKFIPFALPDIGDEEIQAVVKSMKSGWLTTGPVTKKFEAEFAKFISVDECLAVSSATAGLHLALQAINLQKNDTVLIPVNTFVATAEVVRYFDAHPVFIDIDFDTMNISIDYLTAYLENNDTSNIKAIIPVHIAGQACDMDEILKLAKKYNLFVIEDAAHAFPCKYKNQMIGSLQSDFTVYSFYATKTITTGEGGMLVARNKKHLSLIKKLRLHGISREIWDRYTSNKAHWHYDVDVLGYKYNLSDLCSSIGREQLKKANHFFNKRNSIAQKYNQAFKHLDIILPQQKREDDQHAWHLYLIRTKNRDQILKFLKEKGIGTSLHFIPLHLMTYYQELYHHKEDDFTIAMKSFSQLISLPIYTKMSDENIDYVISSLIEACSL